MRAPHSLVLAVVLSASSGALMAQAFVNGDLNGVVLGSSTIPAGWQAVPETDPVCMATANYGATPDLTDAAGPQYANGLMGNPYSGTTYVTGLHAFGSHHEGLQQQVSGFTVGCTYTIGLYQTVSKQINADAMDPTGSWSVYADNTLIGVTATTTSNEPAISLNKPWERRELTFTATATSHRIKFMPTDDDADWTSDGVRMGIDSVWIAGTVPGGSAVPQLGNDTTLCAGTPLLLQAGAGVVDPVWQDGSTGASFTVTSAGTYWVQASAGCAVVRDSIVVQYQAGPTVDLGEDLTLCPNAAVMLDATTAGASYLWSTGAMGATLEVPPGTYWVDVTTSCGTVRDSMFIAAAPAAQADLGGDRVLCIGSTLVLDVEQPGATYLWMDGSAGPSYVVTQAGGYGVVVTLGECTDKDVMNVTVEECGFELELPNVFTPNGNEENDRLVPIRSRGIRSMRTVIANRWGQEVFATNDPLIGWNGKATNGEPVPDGVYFYVVTFTPVQAAPEVRTGTVQVLR